MNAQGIHWKNTEGEFQYYDDEFEKWMSRISKIILDVICALLFTVAARIIFTDVYFWAPFKYDDIIGLFIIGVIVSAAIELVPLIEELNKIKAYGIIFAIGIFVCAGSLFIWGDWKTNSTEIGNMISLYLQDCVQMIPENSGVEYLYYNVNEIMIDGSIVNHLTAIIFFVLFFFAKIFGKNIIMIGFPIFVIVLEMLRGFFPGYDGLLYLFAGIISAKAINITKVHFVLAPGRKYINVGSLRFFWWIILILSGLLIGNIVKFAGTPLAKGVIKYADPVLDVYETVINGVDSTFIHKGFDEERDSDKVYLDNETPKFDYIDVMQVDTDFMPIGDLYFRSFSANTYEDGKWTNETDKLNELWGKYGYNNQSINENILELNAMAAKKYYNVSSFENTQFGGKVTISYFVDMGEKVHLPYFVEPIDGIKIEDDIRYRKDRNLDEISFYTWIFEGDLDSRLGFSMRYTEWEQSYNEYVIAEYTKIPDEMTNVKKIATEIKENAEFREVDELFLSNTYRRDMTYEVAKWLENNTDYNLYLPKLPNGTDPVEYFLGESRTGYCMHYASAATLILRELGIPARYASGYVVREDGFERGIKEFSTIVRDDYAHAWVEIYLSNIGWIPYEVTQGQNEAAIEYWEKKENEAENSNTNNSVNNSVDNNVDNGNSDNQENTDEEDKNDKPEKNETDGKSNKKILVIIIVAPLLIVIVAICILVVKRYRKRFSKRLADEREKQNAITVIRMINRRLYNKLLLSGKIRKLSVKDDEYKEALICNYVEVSIEDWDRYMEIAKAAAFSNRDFTVEEMEFCIDIYLKVSIKPKKDVES